MSTRVQEAQEAVDRANQVAKSETERKNVFFANIYAVEHERMAMITRHKAELTAIEHRIRALKAEPDAVEFADRVYTAHADVLHATENLAVARALDRLEAYGFADGERVAVWEKITPRFKPGPARWVKRSEALVQVYKRGDPAPGNARRAAPDPGDIVLRGFKKDGQPAMNAERLGRGWAFAGQSPEEGGWSCRKVFKLGGDPDES